MVPFEKEAARKSSLLPITFRFVKEAAMPLLKDCVLSSVEDLTGELCSFAMRGERYDRRSGIS